MSDLNAVMATRRGWPTSGAARATVEGGGELGRQGQTKLGSLFWAVIAAVLAMTSLAFGESLPSTFSHAVGANDVLGAVGPVTQFSGAVVRKALREQARECGHSAERRDLPVAAAANELFPGQQTSAVPHFASASVDESQPWGAASFDVRWFFEGSSTAGTTDLEKLSIDYSGPTPTATGFADQAAPKVNSSTMLGDVASAAWVPNAGAILAYAYALPTHSNSPKLLTWKSGRRSGAASSAGQQLAHLAGYGR